MFDNITTTEIRIIDIPLLEYKRRKTINLGKLKIKYHNPQIREYPAKITFNDDWKIKSVEFGCRQVSIKHIQTAVSQLKGEPIIRKEDRLYSHRDKNKPLSGVFVEESENYIIVNDASGKPRVYSKELYGHRVFNVSFNILELFNRPWGDGTYWAYENTEICDNVPSRLEPFIAKLEYIVELNDNLGKIIKEVLEEESPE